jgi:hypothetical protein
MLPLFSDRRGRLWEISFGTPPKLPKGIRAAELLRRNTRTDDDIRYWLDTLWRIVERQAKADGVSFVSFCESLDKLHMLKAALAVHYELRRVARIRPRKG